MLLQKELDLINNVKDICGGIESKEGNINLVGLGAGGTDLTKSRNH